ncbi:prepilin-type N-terminal cleavage/methylation domain-containing protein [Microbacterium luteum]|jgi:MSHA pilin protein MshA|uniref:prepilin-type N-terminal cleavage/methylation domain-containing protein n=1 Tax=Microbacterium luteum TaxID=2782167 RepID=UPI001887D3FD|nr:prepilin-type N-terminal cleavage/methylation domain-containing protein [Microbacterium luteum]
MTTYIAALRRRKENGDAGFSLIELIVVVVILGVLAAIAVPVFLGLQGQAEQSSADSIAANAASQVAAAIAEGDDTVADQDFGNFTGTNVVIYNADGTAATGTIEIGSFFVGANTGAATGYAGPAFDGSVTPAVAAPTAG